ncbi:MAG: DarT ssDNA thymidine ADP-ribosyltransferase family protein [Bacteroidaceae bacterium]|nr:DarT ssDNA thymidine ADP-ribosyltransferase family protein [Bacteroidaceae bacterium]
MSAEILWDYKDLLDWECVTQNDIIKLSDNNFLHKYQDYVDWDYISLSETFKISTENLKLFKDKLNWSSICRRKDFVISEDLLEPFADVLNWSLVSKSMNIELTEELIEKYREYWDWQLLRKNQRVIKHLDSILKMYQAEFNCVDFLEKFESTPFIYHFTHLFNAIDIINERKILSRNKAKGLGLLKYDAAGTVVNRTEKAHPFARFYFRPQTPTQFYNECLGKDYSDEYYYRALNLGLPKCPIPVFFKFDLKEVLMKMPNKCFYSTGNMQTNWSQVKKVSREPNSLNVLHLYSNVSDYENYKQYSQQEFLIEEEFDFSALESFEIICYNEEYVNILKSQLGDDPISCKINADGSELFHRNNRELRISQTESEISIESEYRDSAYLSIKGEGLKELEITETESIQKETDTEIIAYPKIKFVKIDKPIEVHFVDTSVGKRDWLIYKN